MAEAAEKENNKVSVGGWLTTEFLVGLTERHCKNLFSSEQLRSFDIKALAESCRPSLIAWSNGVIKANPDILASKETFRDFLNLADSEEDEKRDAFYAKMCDITKDKMFWRHYPALRQLGDYVESLCKGGINDELFDQEDAWNDLFHIDVLQRYVDTRP